MLLCISGVQLNSDFQEKKTTQLSLEGTATQLVGNSTYIHGYTFQLQETIGINDQNQDSFGFDANLEEVPISELQFKE